MWRISLEQRVENMWLKFGGDPIRNFKVMLILNFKVIANFNYKFKSAVYHLHGIVSKEEKQNIYVNDIKDIKLQTIFILMYSFSKLLKHQSFFRYCR